MNAATYSAGEVVKSDRGPVYDVQFLATPAMTSRSIIYLYRSGFFKSFMKDALRQAAKDRGLVPADAGPRGDAAFIEPSEMELMWSENHPSVCFDWSDAVPRFTRQEFQNRLKLLARSPLPHNAHLFSYRARLVDPVIWQQIEVAYDIVEEPELSEETLPLILGCLENLAGLSKQQGLTAQPQFVRRFTHLLDETDAGVADVFTEFWKVVLTCTDPVTREFNAELHQEDWDQQHSSSSLYGQLRGFINSPSDTTRRQLIVRTGDTISQLKWAPEELFHMLCMNTARTINYECRRLDRAARSAKAASAETWPIKLTLWVGLLVAWRDRICDPMAKDIAYSQGPNMMLAMMEELCKQYEQRQPCLAQLDDPLADMWNAIGFEKNFHGKHLASLPAGLVPLGKALLRIEAGKDASEWLLQLRNCFQAFLHRFNKLKADTNSASITDIDDDEP